MNVNRSLLKSAVQKGIITSQQQDDLWQFFQQEMADVPSFHPTHLLYYFGGLVAIAAMSLFITIGWERFGGFGIASIAIAYMFIGILLTNYLAKRKLIIPSGITAAFVVVLTPLVIYGIQTGLGWWPLDYKYHDYHTIIQGLWIMMEVGTLMVGTIVFYFYKRPFLLLPIAITLWYMSMDIAPLLFFNTPRENFLDYWELRQWVSIGVGLIMILFAVFIDIRSKSKQDYAFHLYLFGLLAFWVALTAMNFNSELSKFLYCCINLGLIFFGMMLSRRTFVVFGGIGILLYLGHLSYVVFKDSILFPFILSFLGFATVYLGILGAKQGAQWSKKTRALLPETIQHLLERE